MNFQGLCIINAFSPSPSIPHFYERMKEELGQLSISLELKTSDEVMALINHDGSLETRLPKYDFVLYLDKDLYLSTMLERAGYRLFNRAGAIALCDDKMLTHITLSGHGIKMPKTVSAPLNYTGISTASFLDNLEREIDYPMVAKSNFGSLGKQVHLLKNREELEGFEKRMVLSPRLYQEFIKESFGFDYRIIVLGGQVVAAMKRLNRTGDFRSNIAMGGKGEKVTLTKEQKETAVKAAGILGLDYAGIDLLMGKDGETILCEVNSNAFLSEIERVSEVNVARAYALHIATSLA